MSGELTPEPFAIRSYSMPDLLVPLYSLPPRSAIDDA